MSIAADPDTVPLPTQTAAPARTARDPRLDVFRGIAMFIILCAHTPGNFFTSWIPARWGFSDATEIFVFCSGVASAIAFGRTFDKAGLALGTARVGFRIWTVYWCHIGMFFAIATMLAAIDEFGSFEKVYIGTLNLWRFFEEPGPQLFGLMTLTYVPNYFDILPMYIVVLMLMPVMVALSKVDVRAPLVLSVVLWVFAQNALFHRMGLEHLHLAFPAEPWSDREWFFNPFGWQLLFYTGFALRRGWIPMPPIRTNLMLIAGAVVIANVFVSNVGFRIFQSDLVKNAFIALTGCAESGFGRCNPAFDFRQTFGEWFDKSSFGVLRYAHYLALAYLAWSLAGDGGHRLVRLGQGAGRPVLAAITKVGQQSLAVFVFSMVMARVMGFVMDVVGRDALTVVLVNFAGWGSLIAVAYLAGWFKSAPWKASTP